MNGKVFVFALVAALLLSGCSARNQETPENTPQPAPAAATESADAGATGESVGESAEEPTVAPTIESTVAASTVEPEQTKGSFQQVDMEHARELMESEENYIILDVRTVSEYEEGHIPGAICLPNEEIGDQAPEQLPDRDQLILVYCRSGNRSKQAAAKLADLGYTHVVEFGGIKDWTGEVEQ